MLLTGMSTIKLIARPYQEKLEADIYSAWDSGARVALAVLPTGGGKTFVFTSVLAKHAGYSCAIAHRKEIVGQISLALNKRGVQHFVIAPEKTVKWIISLHMAEHGISYYKANSRCAVAGVDTLLSKKQRYGLDAFCKRVSLWVMDEGHHVIRGNKWGKAIAKFPSTARGLLVTATPERTDGKGLGSRADGVVDTLVLGPGMRELISGGYLTDYRVFAPPKSVDMTGVSIGSTGDYSQPQMIKRVRGSKIVGDVVEHYLRIAPGKTGITFATDIKTATEITAKFNAVGVPSAVISAKTPDEIRADCFKRLQNGSLLQIVNVDICGEGVDLPAVEVVSFARPTESFVLHCQQFGRVLRLMAGKLHAIIIDHVGNVLRHGLPDAPRRWSLDARDRKSNTRNPDMIPLKSCSVCTGVYEAFHRVCPYCGAAPVIADRSKPEFVDGDLTELDASTLAEMRGEIARIDEPPSAVRSRMNHAGAPAIAAAGASKQHRLRQEAQEVLRGEIAMWAGYQRYMGREDSESYKRFYWRFGVDVMSAQALGKPEAEKLTKEIKEVLDV